MVGVALALGYYANFKMSFSGAANGHQNWNIMRLAHVIISLEREFNDD